jgi:hypothetical protein
LLGIRRNGLNKIFRDYGFDLVPARDPMANLRAILWPGSPPDAAWSKRVFCGTGFSVNMTEQQALFIGQEMRAHRRAVIAEQAVDPSAPAWIAEDPSIIDMELQAMMSDYEELEGE